MSVLHAVVGWVTRYPRDPIKLGNPVMGWFCSFIRFSSGGAGPGIDYQDTPQVHPCRLILDVLSRKVLVVNTHPSFGRNKVHPFETNIL